MSRRQMASYEDNVCNSQIILSQEGHLAWGSSHLQNRTTCPPWSALTRIGSGCFVLISHFLDSFIFPSGHKLQLEKLDCALSEMPHFFIHHPFKALSPEKLQARTLFFSFRIYLENSLLQRFLLFSTRPKVLAFKTEWGLISQSPPSGTRRSKGEFPSNQGVDTSPGRTHLSLCVDTSNHGVLPIITSH